MSIRRHDALPRPLARCAEGGAPRWGPPPSVSSPLTRHLLRPGRTGPERVSPPVLPPPAPRRREGLGNGKVELPILGPDQEAFPFVAVEDMGFLTTIL